MVKSGAVPRCACAIHKQTVEKYLDLYHRLFGIRYSVITNPYGPGQPSSRTAYGVINRMIQLAVGDRPLTVLWRWRAAHRLRACRRRGGGARRDGRSPAADGARL